jgi:flagellar hook-associated protein 1 FlgK
VSQLSLIADIKVLQQDSGKYNVFIATGQSLVVGDRAATLQAVPSAADPTRTAVALVGLAGNVMELSPNAITGGSLGGLMSFRTETLIPRRTPSVACRSPWPTPSTTSTSWASISRARWVKTSSR